MPESQIPEPDLESPEACLAFLTTHFPAAFAWHRFAEHCADKAASHMVLGRHPVERGLPWSRVAIACYEAMAAHQNIRETRGKFRLSAQAIRLRANAIAKFGVNAADPTLNPGTLSQRFLENISVSAAEVAEDSSFPRTQPVRDVLELARSVELLWNSAVLREHLPEVERYCQAAVVAKAKARNSFTA